jgi:hypothetical protein
MGKIVAENISESAEVTFLKHKLSMYIEKLSEDKDIVAEVNKLLAAILVMAQTDAKFDGFVAGLEVAKTDLV